MQSFISVSAHTLEQIRKKRKSSVMLKLKLMGCRSTYGNHLIFMRENKQETKGRF